MRIQHNIMAMNAYRNYSNNASSLSKNLEKLSSGYKINRAGDDAAGLAISEKMRAQITGLDKAQDNAKDGISLVQTAEGALTEVHDMLNRMYSLAEQSANGTYDETDREQLQKEVTELKNEIDRIADSSNFNGIKLLDGSMQDGATVGRTYEFVGTGSSGTHKSAIDMVINVGQPAGSGTLGNIKFDLTASSAGKTGVTVSSAGVVTIKLEKGKDYSASEIQTLLSKATGSQAKADVLEAVKKSTVTGTGITKMGNGSSVAVASTAGSAVEGKSLVLQIGDTSDTFNQLSVSIKDCHVAALKLTDMDISTQDGAKDALNQIKDAINYISDVRGTLGATQNRLDHTINNLSVMEENIQDAESTIRDTDVAEEMMSYTKNNILVQSAQAMLAQANQVPQGVLQLLQ